MDYPQCQTLPPNGLIIVPARIMSGSELICASLLRLVFGGAGWMALAVHVIATEVYVSVLCNLFQINVVDGIIL